MSEHSAERRARAGLKKIRHQFPNTPEGRLMYAIVAQAVSDSKSTEPRVKYTKDHFRHLQWDINAMTAIKYLRSDMPHATAVGVDPEWIRRVFKEICVDFGDIDLQHEEAKQ